MNENEQRILLAISHLKSARKLLKLAGCPKTLERLRLTMTSAQGALRNAGYSRIRDTYSPSEPRKRIKRAPKLRVVSV